MTPNEPTAVREDHNPFPGGKLQVIQWTTYRCPYCGSVFRWDYWPDKVRLGSGNRTCLKCGKPFDDGAREWPELSLPKKLRFFLPAAVIVIVVSIFMTVLLIVRGDPLNSRTASLVFAASLSAALLWSMARILSVRRSIYRYENEPASMRRSLES